MTTRARWARSFVVILVGALFLPGAASAEPPVAGPIAAGAWTGYFEDQTTATNSLSGVDIFGNREGKGDLQLVVDEQGSVHGTMGPYVAKIEWGAVQLGNQQQCSWTAVADVTGTVTLNAAHLPVFSLNLKLRSSESSFNCEPDVPGAAMPSLDTLLLEAATYSGGKITGTSVASTGSAATDAIAAMEASGATVTQHAYWELNSSSASVGPITPDYEQYFLEGIVFDNTYNTSVDWHGNAPGTVNFSLAGVDVEVPGEADVSATFNLGIVPAGTNPLVVIATTADGQTSDSATRDVIIVPLEAWAKNAHFFVGEKITGVESYVLYRAIAVVPKNPLSLPHLDLSGIPILGSVLGYWGICGSSAANSSCPPFQLDVNLEATSLGGLSAGAPVSGGGGLYLGGGTAAAKMLVTGESFTNLTSTALLYDHGLVNFNIPPASIEKDLAPAQLIPGLTALFDVPIVGDILEALLATWKVTLQVTGSGTGTATLAVRPDQSELYFSTGSISPTISLTVKPTLGVKGALWVAVSGTGNGAFTIQIAPQTGLTNCSVSLSAGAEAGFIVWSANAVSPAWTIAQCAQASVGGAPVLAAHLPSGFNSSMGGLPAQNEVHSVPGPRQDGDAQIGAPQNGETILATGVAPQAELDLATGPDGRMASAFAPDANGGISVRLFDGSSWGETLSLSESTAFNPQVAYNSQGNAVAVWGQAAGSFDENDLAGFARTWEIAYAVVKPDGTLATQGSLTQDQVLDFSPTLARAADDSLWLAWVKSPATSLWGPSETPNEIWAARWEADGWGQPESVTRDLVGNLSFDLAAQDDETALLVADIDLDSVPATAEDREIMAFQHGANGWAPGVQLTDNEVLDASPLAAYLSDGSPMIAWSHDGSVVALEGDLRGEPTPWNVAPEGQRLDLASGALLAGPDGSLDLVWSDFTPGGVGIWRAQRPGVHAAWGDPQAIVDGASGIGVLRATHSEGDDLWIGYSKLTLGADANAVPVSSDLAVTQVSPAPPETGGAKRPFPFNCFGGIGGALAAAVVISGRRRRLGSNSARSASRP